jgi:hypothetical protein
MKQNLLQPKADLQLSDFPFLAKLDFLHYQHIESLLHEMRDSDSVPHLLFYSSMLEGYIHALYNENKFTASQAHDFQFKLQQFYESLYAAILSISVQDLNLSVRTINILRSVNINTLDDLLAVQPKELLKTPMLGRKSYHENINLVSDMGLTFEALAA